MESRSCMAPAIATVCFAGGSRELHVMWPLHYAGAAMSCGLYGAHAACPIVLTVAARFTGKDLHDVALRATCTAGNMLQLAAAHRSS